VGEKSFKSIAGTCWTLTSKIMGKMVETGTGEKKREAPPVQKREEDVRMKGDVG